MGLGGGLKPPQTKIYPSPQRNEGHYPFGLGFMIFARFVSKMLINCIIFEEVKEPAAGGIFPSDNYWLKISPPPTPPTILATSLRLQKGRRWRDSPLKYKIPAQIV